MKLSGLSCNQKFVHGAAGPVNFAYFGGLWQRRGQR
jgi:hypothetical protein